MLVFVTLALGAVSPGLVQPNVVWIHLLYAQDYYVSVGHMGVFVVGGSDVRRYDFNGSLVWLRSGTLPYGYGSGISVGNDGVYVIDTSVVQKLDFDGNLVWTREFGGVDSVAFGVSVAPNGVYVVGFAGQPLYSSGLLEKFDSSGNALWTRLIQVTGGYTWISGISVTQTRVFITGSNDCSPHTLCQLPADQAGGFMKAFDSNGNELWSRQSGTPGYSQVSAGPTGIYRINALNGLLAKYDFNGTRLWAVASGPSETLPRGIFATATGIYVVGLHYHVWPFDAFAQRFDTDGNVVWSLIFGTSAQDVASSALSASISPGGIFVSGSDFIGKLCDRASCHA